LPARPKKIAAGAARLDFQVSQVIGIERQKMRIKIAEKAEKPYRTRNNSGGGDFFRRALVGAFGPS
jgi:hypothetical protein